jgi:exopolysaccharide biosynthesis predicted pyruvyltransferase EpsI
MPALLKPIERRFESVLVWPSSFDLREQQVAKWLETTKATVYVREINSLRAMRKVREAILALDTAFFFDFRPWLRIRPKEHRLFAFRTDREKRLRGLPSENIDVSIAAADLDHWLHLIARHAEVWTDRAHVMIAAALLGKEVFYSESTYHKVAGIAKFALGGSVRHKEPRDEWMCG